MNDQTQSGRSERCSTLRRGAAGLALVAGGLGIAPHGPALAASAAIAAERLPRGELVSRHLAGDADFEYFAYRPLSARPGAAILACVHGISRNPRQHLRMMAPLAERYGVVLVAPLFRKARFPAYQRLARDDRGLRPDTLLRRAVRELAAASGADARRLYLFGYSGGAQFVHRAVMRHPERVMAYALGAPGWYTFPDDTQRYPYGLRRNSALGVGELDPAAFLPVPGVVLVGERDDRRGSALRTTDRVMAAQGESRLARGLRWTQAMNEAALARGLPAPIGFEVLPRSPHSFSRSMRRGDMGEKVFRHLFGPDAG